MHINHFWMKDNLEQKCIFLSVMHAQLLRWSLIVHLPVFKIRSNWLSYACHSVISTSKTMYFNLNQKTITRGLVWKKKLILAFFKTVNGDSRQNWGIVHFVCIHHKDDPKLMNWKLVSEKCLLTWHVHLCWSNSVALLKSPFRMTFFRAATGLGVTMVDR